MKVAFFSSKRYDESFFKENNDGSHELSFFETKLAPRSVALAEGAQAVCVFVNDQVDRKTLQGLKARGIEYVALRCAGYNNVDLPAAQELGIKVVRVPAYSPHAVAEHTLALLLTLNRRIHRSYNRVREGNFSLEGLVGFDLHGLTVGIIGTGKIGSIATELFQGFGCQLLCHDKYENESLKAKGAAYVDLDTLFARSDVISLHCPLLKETHHIIDAAAIAKMKKGVTIVNTSRGGLIDTSDVIQGLKTGHIGNLAIDVYEEEESMFFEDQSAFVMQDDVFARLLTFPNVLVTGHQAFFTDTALTQIARVTLANLSQLESTGSSENEVALP
ncbi:2-hydroxyacid dehydrogenase [Pelagicoccus sp. SDUM812005]|uniref:2-hydroxyacid dehydrogenase n=1 Tax=Pelagicoccus sp. SDUM812005 TaxID=3041257 RepID=UPI00280FBB4F|nr:2-hydroxyacid dehydrogenase [Pelagicoccus sp. SDUM812005]MDQ8181713.1 2-hydroxyacid dehydrogenase [Pelagicoccus sp. SDUM812005]